MSTPSTGQENMSIKFVFIDMMKVHVDPIDTIVNYVDTIIIYRHIVKYLILESA